MVRWRPPTTGQILFGFVLLLVAYLVLGPLGMLLYGAFTDGPPGKAVHWTLFNFTDALRNPATWSALRNTLIYSLGASAVAFTLGTFAAWVTERTNTPLRPLIAVGSIFPMFIPTVLMAAGWSSLLSPRSGLINGWLQSGLNLAAPPIDLYTLGGMIFIEGLMHTPLAFLWMWPAFRQMDSALEEAAFVNGAGLGRTFLHITLPLAAPAFMAAWLILLVTTLEGLAVPLLIGLPGRVMVLATEIYLATSRIPTNINLASAYAVLLLIFSLAGVFLYRRATARSERFATVTGRGYRPHRLDLGGWRFLTCALSLIIVILTAVLPTLALVWNSLTPYAMNLSSEALPLLTVANYQKLPDISLVRRSLVNSAYLGLVAGIGTMACASVAAWVILRTRLRGRGALDFLASVPMAIPGIVVGISLIWVYLMLPIPIYGTAWILVVAYLTRFLPYGVRIAYAAFSQVQIELEEVAATCGATWGATFRRILMPLLAPGLAVGVVYIMLRAFRELAASLMLVSYGTEVFSVAVYDLWSSGEVGLLSAFALFTIAVLVLLVLLVQRTGARFGIRP